MIEALVHNPPLTAINKQFLEGNMTLKPIVHEIRIQNQVIFLDPPIEHARSTWIQQLHDWLGSSFDPGPQIFRVYLLSVTNRYRLSTAAHPKFPLRNWAPNARSSSGRDILYIPGTHSDHPRFFAIADSTQLS